MQITVTPQYINAAKPDKKYGSIKCADGTRFMLPRGMEGGFSKGMGTTVDVEYEDWGNGQVAVIRNIAGGQAPAPQQVGQAAPQIPAPVAHQPQTGTLTDRSIFVQAFGKAIIEANPGKYDHTNLHDLIPELVGAYDMFQRLATQPPVRGATGGTQPVPPRNDPPPPAGPEDYGFDLPDERNYG